MRPASKSVAAHANYGNPTGGTLLIVFKMFPYCYPPQPWQPGLNPIGGR